MPAEPAARHGLHQHPDATSTVDPRPADARVLPGRRHSYAHVGGEHQFKVGVQVDRVGNDVLSGEPRNARDDPLGHRACSSGVPSARHVRLLLGAQQRRRPEAGLHHPGRHPHEQHRPVHPGLLDDQQPADDQPRPPHRARERADLHRPADGDIPEFGIEFGFARQAGAARRLRLRPQGRRQVEGLRLWGMFYDIFKLELPRGSFGGDKWLEYYYTLDTSDWPNLVDGRAARRPARARSSADRSTSVTRRSASDAIEPEPEADEAAGSSRPASTTSSTTTMAVSVRYVHKQLDRAIEDTGFLDAGRQRGLRHRQPGRGPDVAGVHQPERRRCRRPKRDYDSVEFAFDKRLPNNWSLRASYMWSRLYGNYSGLSQSDENGRTSPNVGRAFDYPAMMFDQHGGSRSYGPLATDRPHQFKAQFIYQFNFGTSVGAQRVPRERPAGHARDRHLPAEQLPGPVPGPRQRRPDGHVLADRPVRAARVQVRRRQTAAAQLQRAQPVQPGGGGLEVLDLPEDRRRRRFDEDGVLRGHS